MSEMGKTDPGRTIQAAGIVLAAGRSERMGSPKALLRCRDGATFISRAIRTLEEAGLERIVVVANPDTREAIAVECAERAELLVNPRPEDGMISSIRIAVASFALDIPERMIVTLVDIPDSSTMVTKILLDAELPDRTILALPRFDDGPGHPVMLLSGIRTKLDEDLPRGLKSIMEKYPELVAEVACVGRQPWDVDTPQDYERRSS